MSKRHKNKPAPGPRRAFDTINAPTVFRATLLSPNLEELVQRAIGPLEPLLRLRDGPAVERIKQAQTVEELLDLASETGGLADPVWLARMRSFGRQAVAPISQRLRGAAGWSDTDGRAKALERFLTVFKSRRKSPSFRASE